jgi:hypothetical protein
MRAIIALLFLLPLMACTPQEQAEVCGRFPGKFGCPVLAPLQIKPELAKIHEDAVMRLAHIRRLLGCK